MTTSDLTAISIGLTITAALCLVIRAYRYLCPETEGLDEIHDDPRPAQVLREGQRGVRHG